MRRWLIGLSLVAVLGVVVVEVSGGRSSAALFEPPVLGGQPAGALVLSRQDRGLAVALAVKPLAGRTLVVATVLAPDGEGAAGLRVRFRAGGTEAAGEPGASGTYAAALSPTRPIRVVRVSLGRADPLVFRLPSHWRPQSGRRELAETTRAYRRLRTLVIRERLASAPGSSLSSIYRAAAPDRLSITSSNGDRSVVIGGRRWDRHPGAGWQRSVQEPPLDPMAPFWRGIIEDPTIVGRDVVDGRRLVRLSFAAPQIPAFFEVTVDETDHLPRELEMIAAAHFMHHTYSGFDRSLSVTPPA